MKESDMLRTHLSRGDFPIRILGVALLLGFLGLGKSAEAQTYRIEITNVGNSDFYLAPTWVGFHGGSYDVFENGQMASNGLELLAEDGIVSGLQADFAANVTAGFQTILANPSGFGGAPIIDPGETATSFVSFNGANNRFLNFASMVIPSNDSFIGNDSAIQVFDGSGNVLGGTFTFNILENQIWDAGTEINDEMGAAFSLLGGTSSDENGLVHLQLAGELNRFVGTGTPAGTIQRGINGNQVLATFSISQVPEPSTFGVLLMAGLGVVVGRRRR